MVDYAKLAIKAKKMQDAEKLSAAKKHGLKVDPRIFFENVKTHLLEEMKKANVELYKRNAVGFGQNHMPGFDDEIFITFGTDLLCRITLVLLGGRCHIKAVLSGPPNGYEISRKEYCFNEEESDTASLCEEPAVTVTPAQIAVDIISSVMVGKFE
jgi:hypothetical protein